AAASAAWKTPRNSLSTSWTVSASTAVVIAISRPRSSTSEGVRRFMISAAPSLPSVMQRIAAFRRPVSGGAISRLGRLAIIGRLLDQPRSRAPLGHPGPDHLRHQLGPVALLLDHPVPEHHRLRR